MNTQSNEPYKMHQHLRELVQDNPRLLMALSRFGIPSNRVSTHIKDLSEIDIHPQTFLAVANLISGKCADTSEIDLSSLTNYLKRAHTYFLEFCLPSIRRKLIHALDYTISPELTLQILQFFDDYVNEVRCHMNYEDLTLFPYISKMLSGEDTEGYSIDIFAQHHDAVASKLCRLKDVLIRYSGNADIDLMNSVLFDIINTEIDLSDHCMKEDEILIPAVKKAERNKPEPQKGKDTNIPAPAEILAKREKEILACVAKGMSNKEIADSLCISIHTVTTHRRNICSKLGLHSSAALTIYSILNGVIDLKDIDM